MLQTMRNNAQGMIAKIIMGFLILVFALWGVESIVSIGSGEAAVVKVGDQKVTEAEILRAIEQQKVNLSRQFGDQFDENLFTDKFLRQSAIEQLIEEIVAIQQAKKLGLAVSSTLIDNQIRSIPAFQVDGRFNREQFQTVLSLNGLTPLSLRDNLGKDSLVNQAQAGFALSGLSTPFSAQLLGALDQEARTFRFTEIKSRDFEANITPTEDAINNAYQAALDQFRIPELVSVRYLELSLADLAAKQTVSRDELEAAYQQTIAQEAQSEQRQASHILLEVGDQRNQAQAQALAQELKARLDKGEDFAVLAKEYSDDSGSKGNGGDLGITPRGSFDPAFDDALYALAEGEVSAPVQTEFGIHLIRAGKIIKPEVRTFEQMQAELSQDILKEKAQQQYEEKLKELSEMAFSATSLDELAKETGLSVKETALFSQAEGQGPAAQSDFRAVAFGDAVLFAKELSSVVELKDSAFVMAIKEHQPESVKPLNEVRAQLVTQIKREQALEMAKQQAEAVLADGSKAPQWQTVTATYSMTSEAPRLAQQRAFSLVQGKAAIVPSQGSYLVVDLIKVDAKPWQDVQVETAMLENERFTDGRNAVLSYQAWARHETDIKR